jgi:hypothetical protein
MSIPMATHLHSTKHGMLTTTTYSTKHHLVAKSLQLMLLAAPHANTPCIEPNELVLLIVEIKIITSMKDKLKYMIKNLLEQKIHYLPSKEGVFLASS